MQERSPQPPHDDKASPTPPHDDVDASKMPLMDHLIELRTRLIYAIVAFFVMFLLCFTVAKHIYNVLVWPYIWASGNQAVRLIATHFLEQLFTNIKLAMFGAAFLSFPIVAAQIYKFVAPGLYKTEKRAFLPFLLALGMAGNLAGSAPLAYAAATVGWRPAFIGVAIATAVIAALWLLVVGDPPALPAAAATAGARPAMPPGARVERAPNLASAFRRI